MKTITAILACILLASTSWATNRIDIARLQDKGSIVGRLGLPLGQIVTIQCTGMPTPSEQTKDEYWTRSVNVLSVNQKKLDKPIVMEFRSFSWAEVKLPKPNEIVIVVGYETGGYKGIPGEAFKYIPSAQTAGYRFETEFKALKKITANQVQQGTR